MERVRLGNVSPAKAEAVRNSVAAGCEIGELIPVSDMVADMFEKVRDGSANWDGKTDPPRRDHFKTQSGIITRKRQARGKAEGQHVEEMAALLGICRQQVKIWNQHGLIRGHPYNDKNDCLYEHPGENPPRKAQGIKLSQRVLPKVVSQGIEEVQCEA